MIIQVQAPKVILRGGSTKNMSKAKDPTTNVSQWFTNWGKQVQGAGGNANVFLGDLQGKNQAGQPVKGWKTYNSDHPATWWKMATDGINQMLREIPIY
jgi:hypothetical protein